MPTTAEKKTTLMEALLAIQQDRPTLTRDKEGAHGARYISLDSLLAAVLPRLNEHDLVLTQHPTHVDGIPALLTRLVHTPSGEKDESTMLLMAGKEDPQAQGSAITYARRYALVTLLGLTADEDDDGARASNGTRASGQVGATGGDRPISEAQRKVVWGKAKGAGLTNTDLFRVLNYATRGKVSHPDGVKLRSQLDYVIAALEHIQAHAEEDWTEIGEWERAHPDLAEKAGEKPEPEIPADPPAFEAGATGDSEDIPFAPSVA